MKADVRIFKDSEALSQAAAGLFVEAAVEAVETRGRFLVALSGGGTPAGLYHLIAKEPHRHQVDWLHTFVFWGDERCVPPDDAGSNYRQAVDTLLSHVPIPVENILRIKGELEPAEASRDYARILKDYAPPGLDWPRFDLVLLGMGEDGHTASLFPGSEVEATSPTQCCDRQLSRPPGKSCHTDAVGVQQCPQYRLSRHRRKQSINIEKYIERRLSSQALPSPTHQASGWESHLVCG